GKYGEVLQGVWAGIRILQIIEGNAVAIQVDAQSGVGRDAVTPDAIAGAGGVQDGNPRPFVELDGVAAAGGRAMQRPAADGIVARTGLDEHAVVSVGQGHRARDIGADVVALDHVAGRAAVADDDAVKRVARDDVPSPGRGAANGVV